MNSGRYHWSNLAREVLFFSVNWVAALPWILLIFYQSWMLFGFAIFSLVALFYVRVIAKMTISSAWRTLFATVSGKEKATNNWFKDFIRHR
jgi:ABC-type bacteriocin/lantibiotic exporter with double-glycine peptidase domain